MDRNRPLREQAKAVIFDMDGVIFDSEQCVIDCWKEVAERHDITGIEAVCLECIGTNDALTEKIVRSHYGEDFPYDTYRKEMSALYHERYDHGKLPKKPGVRELLETLQENGLPCAVASSTREAVVTAQLKDAGLYPFFRTVIGGDMVEHSKPHPEIFLKAAEALKTAPWECLVIEDSLMGIRAASAGGMIPVMVPDLVRPDQETERMVFAVKDSLLDVRSLLFEP